MFFQINKYASFFNAFFSKKKPNYKSKCPHMHLIKPKTFWPINEKKKDVNATLLFDLSCCELDNCFLKKNECVCIINMFFDIK